MGCRGGRDRRGPARARREASPRTWPPRARAEAVANCREDSRWAREIAVGTGYVPHTMLVLPLGPPERPFGVLQILDRLDGGRYGPADVERGLAFADLALAALDRGAGDTILPPSL